MAEEIPTTVESSPTPTKEQSFDWIKVIIASIIGPVLLAVSAYGGYWYGTQSAKLKTQISKPQPKTQNQQAQESTTQQTPTSTLTLTLTESTDHADKTARWKIYESPYGYSLRYPDNMSFTTISNNDLIEFTLKGKDFKISSFVVRNLPESTLSEYIEKYDIDNPNKSLGPQATKACDHGTLDDHPSYRCRGRIASPQNSYYISEYFKLGKGIFLELRGLTDSGSSITLEDFEVIFNQILSTFKFLD